LEDDLETASSIAAVSSSRWFPGDLRTENARIGLCGVAGSGKTLAALKIARGLGKRIACRGKTRDGVLISRPDYGHEKNSVKFNLNSLSCTRIK
jgi:hypothetical protein